MILEPIDLRAMVENVVEDCRAQAPELTILADCQPGLTVQADPELLEQVLQNLASGWMNRRPSRTKHLQ